jgi:hypothetical protein
MKLPSKGSVVTKPLEGFLYKWLSFAELRRDQFEFSRVSDTVQAENLSSPREEMTAYKVRT